MVAEHTWTTQTSPFNDVKPPITSICIIMKYKMYSRIMKGNIQREAHLDENLENTALFEPRIENEEGTGIMVCTYLYR